MQLLHVCLGSVTKPFSSTYHRAVCIYTTRLQVGVQSYHNRSNCLILKATEKTLHSTDNYPERVALAADYLNVAKSFKLPSKSRRAVQSLATQTSISTMIA